MDHAGSSAIPKALENHHYGLTRNVLVKAQRLGLLNPESPVICNALFDACRKGDLQASEVLMDFTSRWNSQDADKRTLMNATKEGRHQEIIYQLTLQMGANHLSLRDK